MKKQATKRATRDLPVKNGKDVKGGLGSIGNAIGSVVKVVVPVATA